MSTSRRLLRVALAGAVALAVAPAMAFAAGVTPATSTQTMAPGTSVTITKTVSTPVIAPKPDIVLLVDSTGSMGSAIANVQAGMTTIISSVKAVQPDAQFAVADYKDFLSDDPYGSDPYGFRVDTGLTSDATAATNAVNAITADGGGDAPESQLNALWQIGGGGGAITFRPGSSRIVVWFGDAPGHDPSNTHTRADAIASLNGVNAQVLAVNVGDSQLDSSGQATAITAATNGSLYSGVNPTTLTATILAGLKALPSTVTPVATCKAGLSVSFAPATKTVAAGVDAVFEETATLAADAKPGATPLTCTTDFQVNGAVGAPGYTQTLTVTVKAAAPDLAVTCAPGPNPSGKIMPAATGSGFFLLKTVNGTAPVTVTIADTKSSFVTGPYPAGTAIKLTQAPGAKPSASKGTGEVDYQIKLKGDALVTATDAAGNTATATCSVPPSK